MRLFYLRRTGASALASSLPFAIALSLSVTAVSASRAFAADVAELPELALPATNAHAGCAFGDASEDPEGRRQLCCAADTNEQYFADPEVLENAGDCGGHWAATTSSCDVNGVTGITWTCSVPSAPIEDWSPSPELGGDDAIAQSFADVADADAQLDEILGAALKRAHGHHHAHAHGHGHGHGHPSGGDGVHGAPSSGGHHSLAAIATRLARLGSKAYNAVQRRWVHTTYPACNYFVISALCEDGQCHGRVPMVQASAFGSYLRRAGWHEVSLSEVKNMFRRGESFDSIMVRASGRHGHGHVLIPVAAERTGFTVAQASLGKSTHGIRTMPDSYLAGRFRAYVRR